MSRLSGQFARQRNRPPCTVNDSHPSFRGVHRLRGDHRISQVSIVAEELRGPRILPSLREDQDICPKRRQELEQPIRPGGRRTADVQCCKPHGSLPSRYSLRTAPNRPARSCYKGAATSFLPSVNLVDEQTASPTGEPRPGTVAHAFLRQAQISSRSGKVRWLQRKLSTTSRTSTRGSAGSAASCIPPPEHRCVWREGSRTTADTCLLRATEVRRAKPPRPMVILASALGT